MFSKTTEGLRHCYTQSIFLFTSAVVNSVSDGLSHLHRSASTGPWFSFTLSITENQTKHVIFQALHFLNNADASRHFLRHIRQDKTCIVAIFHFINSTDWSRCSLETRGLSCHPVHTEGSTGPQFGATITLLNSDFVHLKEMMHPLLVIHVCAAAFQ